MTPAESASLQQRAEALEKQAHSLADPREEARVLSELGRVRLSLGDGEQALLALARALFLAPDNAATIVNGLRGALAREVLEELKVDAPAAARSAIERALE